jgi:hypothetical protein
MITLPTVAGPAQAAPIEGEVGSNAASLLVLLGIGALLMGMRNLRELRHKRLTPEQHRHDTEATPPEENDSLTDG